LAIEAKRNEGGEKEEGSARGAFIPAPKAWEKSEVVGFLHLFERGGGEKGGRGGAACLTVEGDGDGGKEGDIVQLRGAKGEKKGEKGGKRRIHTERSEVEHSGRGEGKKGEICLHQTSLLWRKKTEKKKKRR